MNVPERMVALKILMREKCFNLLSKPSTDEYKVILENFLQNKNVFISIEQSFTSKRLTNNLFKFSYYFPRCHKHLRCRRFFRLETTFILILLINELYFIENVFRRFWVLTQIQRLKNRVFSRYSHVKIYSNSADNINSVVFYDEIWLFCSLNILRTLYSRINTSNLISIRTGYI